MINFGTIATVSEQESLISRVIEWIHEAGNPYYDFVFGSKEVSLKMLEKWIQQASSEIFIQSVIFLMQDSHPVGCYIALPGNKLNKARKADLLSIIKNKDMLDIEKVKSRLSSVNDLFYEVGNDEFYLSKIAVDAHYRNQGYGKVILNEYLREGQSLGFKSFHLDVSAKNSDAIHFYKSFGFSIISESENKNNSLKYYAMRKTL